MALVTQQQLNDASTDCQTLSDVVNGAPATLVSRLGRSLSTIAKLISDFVAALPSYAGAWSSGTAYAAGKWVTNGGSSYYAIQAVPAGTAITNTAYWILLAQTGDISQARTQNNTWTATNTFSSQVVLSGGITPPTWTDVTSGFLNQWTTNAGAGFFRYTKTATGLVIAEGSLYSGSLASAAIYTMPAGYRPAAPVVTLFPVGQAVWTNTVTFLQISSSSGSLSLGTTSIPNNTWVSFLAAYPSF
jgi:hypothetical protein